MIEIIPNAHPIFVHFSIALLTVAALLFLLTAFAGDRPWRHSLETVANWNLWIGAAVSIATVAAGLQAAGTVAHDDLAHVAMENHKYWAFGTAGLFLLLALWNGWRVGGGRRPGPLFVALMMVGLVGLAGTGLRGADLVFRHGLGVMSLPDTSEAGHSHGGAGHSHGEDAGHSHDGEAMHSHDADADHVHGDGVGDRHDDGADHSHEDDGADSHVH